MLLPTKLAGDKTMLQLIFVYLLEGMNMRKRLQMTENGRLTGMMVGGIVMVVAVGICTGGRE
jgi:hypothetical protein